MAGKVYHYPKDCIPHDLRCKHQDEVMVLRPWLCHMCTADDAYNTYAALNNTYRSGSPLVPDKVFDRFESLCRDRWPEDKRFHQVGETKTPTT